MGIAEHLTGVLMIIEQQQFMQTEFLTEEVTSRKAEEQLLFIADGVETTTRNIERTKVLLYTGVITEDLICTKKAISTIRILNTII
jgi:hypothetical protein